MATRRVYGVSHSYRGFELTVRDFPLLRWLVGELGHRLTALLDRKDLLYPIADAILHWQHEGSEVVADLPLTTAQALTINPWLWDEVGGCGWITTDGVDEDGNVFRDSALVGALCPDCGELVDADGRWWMKVMEDHAPYCAAA